MRLTLDLFGHRLDLTLDQLCDHGEPEQDDTDDEDHPQGDVYANTERADPWMPPLGFGPNPREDQ